MQSIRLCPSLTVNERLQMAANVRYGSAGGTWRRGAAIVATISVHLLLLLMVLSGHGTPPIASMPSTALTVFDVVPPPPPVMMPRPPPPPVPPRIVAPMRPTPRDGGAPGQAKPAPSITYTAPARQVDMLVEPLPTPTTHGEIPLPGLAALATASAGAGTGSGGGGGGDGRGRGTGSGSGDGRAGLARALWIRVPTPREYEAYWPERARRDRITGRVLLSCFVPRPGPPRRCKVIDEYPKGVGFGDSALRLSGVFRIQPVTRGSEVQKLPVIVPISFDVPMEINLPSVKN